MRILNKWSKEANRYAIIYHIVIFMILIIETMYHYMWIAFPFLIMASMITGFRMLSLSRQSRYIILNCLIENIESNRMAYFILNMFNLMIFMNLTSGMANIYDLLFFILAFTISYIIVNWEWHRDFRNSGLIRKIFIKQIVNKWLIYLIIGLTCFACIILINGINYEYSHSILRIIDEIQTSSIDEGFGRYKD